MSGHGDSAGGPGRGAVLDPAVDSALAFLRTVDPDAAAEVDEVRRREVGRPAIVVVGETKRGKSSLVNALIGVPGLSPVDVSVATSAYLEFQHAASADALAWLPGRSEPVALGLADLRDWATRLGRLPDDATRPPRRVEVRHPAPLLRYLTLVDTPGTGGLDAAHAEVALDAVGRASVLLFVVDASAPFTRPELDFLIEASKRVNAVVFALSKVDAYPGWRSILADNRAQLQVHAPRFGSAPWFPVSARLAELALGVPREAAGELIAGSGIAELQHALVELAGNGHLLNQANVLRTVRSELVRLDLAVGERIRATDPDPAEVARTRQERAALAARKRTESRQWSLALHTHTRRAQVSVTGALRGYVGDLQEDFLARIDKARGEEFKALPRELDAALHALSVRLSADLRQRFCQVGEQVLAQVFGAHEVRHVLGGLNAQLRQALNVKPPRQGAGPDNVMVVMSSAGMAFLAGRGAVFGASALGAGSVVGAGLLVPAAGLGLGLAAGAFVIYRRRVQTDREQARVWLREVLAEARAALTDEIVHRFTDLQYALTLALDDAIERRLRQLDAHIAEIDQAMADDKASRTRRRQDLQRQREVLRGRIRQVDEVLVRARSLAPTSATPAAGVNR